MSFRYSICLSKEELEKRYSVMAVDQYRPRYNAAPGQLLPVISNAEPDSVSLFYWGQIPDRSKNKTISDKLIYVSSDLVKQKTSSLRNIESSRCIIPADGFYIWKSLGKKSKIPYRVIFNTGEAFSFAGIWEAYEDENDQKFITFKIITTAANPVVGEIQDFMPVLLTREGEKNWLDNDASVDQLLALTTSYPPGKMTKFTISPKINSTDVDDPSLIQAAPAADQFGNYSLFD